MKEKNLIIQAVQQFTEASSSQLHAKLAHHFSLATLKRYLSVLINENKLIVVGRGKASKYQLHPHYELFLPINLETYYQQEIDERSIKKQFNWELLQHVLPEINLFTESENSLLQDLQKSYLHKKSLLSTNEYNKELDRLAIDLSWKSSQIEGNTYSLLETELLLKEKRTAKGKTKEEASMLLNHKATIDFLLDNKHYANPLNVSIIENIHSLLIEDLAIDRNIRKRGVGITGTNYQPIDNDFQIREALEISCLIINNKKNVFEKALLVLLLISYIQPFTDGNKRTARILSNAILIDNDFCPLSFRTVDPIEYKKAMLVFYEQNNITPFKELFIEQYDFAVKTYF